MVYSSYSSYTTTINNTSGKDSGNLTTNMNSNQVDLVNTYNELVPTGLIVKYWPYILIVVTVITGIILFIIAKKKMNKDKEEKLEF